MAIFPMDDLTDCFDGTIDKYAQKANFTKAVYDLVPRISGRSKEWKELDLEYIATKIETLKKNLLMDDEAYRILLEAAIFRDDVSVFKAVFDMKDEPNYIFKSSRSLGSTITTEKHILYSVITEGKKILHSFWRKIRA